MGGLLVSAPASGQGKTTVTLGLLRAMRRRGWPVRSAKSGPDYIDGRFHEAATGRACVNLDAWAMGEARLRALAGGRGPLVVEGAMGLFDGAPPDGRGSAADLARLLGLPVVLVVDASRMAQSAGPLVAGFAAADPGVRVAGVVLNRLGSDRHRLAVERAVERAGLPVLGALPRDEGLAHPARHLGLVGAGERPDLEDFLERAADALERHADVGALAALAGGADLPETAPPCPAPPGRRIAVARDAAFAFAYPHLLAEWRTGGAEVALFSPLADEAVPEGADFVFLPGGYPELHAARIGGAARFMASLRGAARRGVAIHGECGGYMVLGEALVDAAGEAHPMAGLLGLRSSFARRRLHLGYRRVEGGWGPLAGSWTAHEFHYATVEHEAGEPLWKGWDTEGAPLGRMGLRRGSVAGSFAHLIDRAADGQGAAAGLGAGA
ncbi:cobyrinate a,c-diamide synthase [Rubellimicrobium sp. CFH 75288]|uniref:cobyrinate a,c-diamide synthase n=1 Tax=Rubellimicrobium sp. CFH 75288 TaxID=2697034 RepID=UPI00141207D0|nr:cobyrinate a,c-diamide synthase [Rubellimicrobium sp. CFH 75288]NAZ35217.1 cobyrinate a,c-diamide synthase [Rubellimicrobium sp. CFH 75288]